jgi:hypothetical protein
MLRVQSDYSRNPSALSHMVPPLCVCDNSTTTDDLEEEEPAHTLLAHAVRCIVQNMGDFGHLHDLPSVRRCRLTPMFKVLSVPVHTRRILTYILCLVVYPYTLAISSTSSVSLCTRIHLPRPLLLVSALET